MRGAADWPPRGTSHGKDGLSRLNGRAASVPESCSRAGGEPRADPSGPSSVGGETEAGKGGGPGTRQRRHDLGSATSRKGQVTEKPLRHFGARVLLEPAQDVLGLPVVPPLPWKVQYLKVTWGQNSRGQQVGLGHLEQ